MAKRKKSSADKAPKKSRTFAIRVPESIWVLLNRVAFQRAQARGGRPSMNAILIELVRLHERQLKKEIGEG